MPDAAHRAGTRLPRVPSLLLACVLLLNALPAASFAARCGDDVDGRGTRVRCACGDVVVSSVRLDAADPIAQAPCAATGLVVDIPSTQDLPTLDLGGLALAGSGRGIGIDVLAGGRRGLAIVGPGTVRGFDHGVVAREGALAQVSSLHADGNARDGFRLAGRGYQLVACSADHNGRDGFVLQGEDYRLDDCTAVANGRDGFAVRGRPATPVDGANAASDNGRHGARTRSRAARSR
ncbi:MAG TPA: hypothetical protein VGR62_13105 [Candidatus Binatia bacterium]|jgi:hypothetical protein|nr:hypothetical protein [Candidatus Binatia bacterium]